MVKRLNGERHELYKDDPDFPEALRQISRPPEKIYVIGDVSALCEGLAVVGSRRATPYGKGCAKRFAGIAAERGIVIISGGARGCDSASHEAALEKGGRTVVFLGGGCDEIYPACNFDLFQKVIDCGGAIVSEQDWTYKPLPFAFRERNRLIAGLAKATLIVEAGLPSGTFSTADEALAANREVLVVPGSITSKQSAGSNRLLYQGATPIVDDETFSDQLFAIFGCLKQEDFRSDAQSTYNWWAGLAVMEALAAEPLSLESIMNLIISLPAKEQKSKDQLMTELMLWINWAVVNKVVALYPDGRYGPVVTEID
jgi:DNA processing protein